MRNLRKGIKQYVGSAAHRATAARIGKAYGFGTKNPTTKQIASRSLNGTTNITRLNLSSKNPTYKRKNRKAAADRLRKMDPRIRKIATLRGLHSRWHNGPIDVCSICSQQLPNLPNNHKVISVRRVGRADVYDITVDHYHNFALTAGVFVHNSIRDIAGIATVAIVPFISKRESIIRATLTDEGRIHPFSVLEWDPAFKANFRWDAMVRQTADGWVPLIDPDAPRHVHIDFAVSGDSVGFVVAHVSKTVEVVRGVVGEQHVEILPEIYVDFILRIIPPTGEQIEMAVARSLIYELIDHGYHISFVHADSWQSTDTLQQLRRRGLRAEVLSVDRTPVPYEFLRDALYERRVRMYPYPTLERELRCLEFDREHNKVDHPEFGEDGKMGSKDVADSLAGVVLSLTEGGVAQLPPPMMSERLKGPSLAVMSEDFYFKDEAGEVSLLADAAFGMDDRPTKNEVWVQTVAKFLILGGGTLPRNLRVIKVGVEMVSGGVRVTVRTPDGVQASAQGPNEAALIFDPMPKYIRPDARED